MNFRGEEENHFKFWGESLYSTRCLLCLFYLLNVRYTGVYYAMLSTLLFLTEVKAKYQ